jgi:beta-lactam-binding protein with PASTA domain
VQVGPGGIKATGPKATGAKPRAPRVPSKSFDLKSLRKGGGAGAAAMPAAFTGPLLPTQAVFRQKPWIPRWVAFLLLFLIILAVLLFLLIPRTVAVPDIKGKKVFGATKTLTEAQLTLDPVIKQKVAPNLPPGTIIDQTPAPGKKVKKQSQVHVITAIGTGNKSVPDVVGKTLTEANSIIEKKGLTVGAVNPQPPDPEGKVKSQIPAAGEVAKEGKPIQLFLETAADKKKAAGGGAAGGGGGGGGGGAKVVIPAIGKDDLEAYAAKIAELQLTPIKQTSFSDTAEAGALFGTDPEGGTEVEVGSEVKLLVSAGFPQIAYDNDRDVVLVNGADGKKLETIAKSPRIEKEPAFTLSGSGLAFISAAKPPPDQLDSPDGIIQLANRAKPDQAPVALTPQGEKWRVPSFAPTADANVLAAIKFGDEKKLDGDICLGAVTKDGYLPKCLDDGGLSMKRVIRWGPDGKSLFGFAIKEPGVFGMVRYTTKTPYSPNADDWSKGKFVTDITQTDKGVIDLAFSPDGKRMAIVSNFGAAAAGFLLSFAPPGDFQLAKNKPTPVEACKIAWRPDSLEVAVVQADDCQDGVGDIARVDARNPSKTTILKAGGDSPAYQPVLPEEPK